MSNPTIIITGGGTGGHVFPALAIAHEMKRRDWNVLYVGTATGMESSLVPQAGFPFYSIQTGAVKNQTVLKIIKTLWRLIGGVFWALSFLREKKPRAVLGVGGYVSVPICFAAFLLRIPLYLQEQNSSVGIANRFLGLLAKRIFLGFQQALPYFKSTKCLVTGNPLRQTFYDVNFPEYNPNANFLLILGGSQGAKSINDALLSFIERLYAKNPKLKIFHQTGQKDFNSVQSTIGTKYKNSYEYSAFINDIASLYAKASLVIARSGALTVSELIQMGRPAIFVPYPRIGQNDQITNAYMLQNAGAARVVEQGPQFNDRLEKTLDELFTPSVLEKMNKNFAQLRFGNALASIGDQLTKDALSQ